MSRFSHYFGPSSDFLTRGYGRPPSRANWSWARAEQRRHRVFPSADLRLVLLKLLRGQPSHGYDLLRAIQERTKGAYAPSSGTVYPLLHAMVGLGLIRQQVRHGCRKTYEVTSAGVAHLDERRAELEQLFDRLTTLAVERRHMDESSVRRAIENLSVALMERLGSANAAADIVHAMTAILDETARKIEML